MSGNSINFEDKKINKSNFYKNKKLFNVHDSDVNKILVSKKESYGTKTSLKTSFKVGGNKLFKKYNKICEKNWQSNEYRI